MGFYLLSFVLPMNNNGLGFGAFHSAFVFGFVERDTPPEFPSNTIRLLWSANVLTWFVAVLLIRGRYRAATMVGLVATWFASFAIRPLGLILPFHQPGVSVYDVAFWAWWGSMLGLTGSAIRGWRTLGREQRPRMTIGSVMLLVGVVALGLMVYR